MNSPTHRLKAFHKVSGKSSEVGAGWTNEETGHINIVLNDFVLLHQKEAICFILFPIDKQAEVNHARRKSYARKRSSKNPSTDKTFPTRNFKSYENMGYGRLSLAAAYHTVMHDISVTRFSTAQAAAWDYILPLLEARRDSLYTLGHSEVNQNLRDKARK